MEKEAETNHTMQVNQKHETSVLKSTIGVVSASKQPFDDENNITKSETKEEELTTTTKKGIITPNENDILSGRGAGVHSHPGNVRYRKLIQSYKLQYVKSDPAKKKQIIKFVFNIAKQYGRFLKLDPITEDWTLVSDEEARMKVGQALRENSPKIKNQNGQKGGEWLKFQEIVQSNPFSDEEYFIPRSTFNLTSPQDSSTSEYLIPRSTFNLTSPQDSLTSTQMKSDSTSLNQTGSHAPIIHLWSQINALQDKYDDLKQKQRQLE